MMRAAPAIVVAAALLWTAAAHAEETEAARLFREGRADLLVGNFDAACPRIAESQRLEPHVGTLLNLAACHERQGKVASAWVEYQKGLTAARAEGQAERATLAQARIDVLEARVPWLTIAPPRGGHGGGAREVVVELDGAVVQPAAWGKELPVDPGPHVVSARLEGQAAVEERLALAEGEHRTSTLDLGGSPAAEEPPAAVVIEPLARRQAATEEKSRWVLELGVLVGYLTVGTERARPTGPESAIVVVDSGRDATPGQSCASVGCTYELSSQPGSIVGPSLFAGYAFADDIAVGLRVVAAPRLERGGGSIVAAGPAASLRAGRSWSFGAWALLGSATVGAHSGASIEATPPYQPQQTGGFTSLTASTDLGFGLGFEASFRIAALAHGTLLATTQPFFLAGSNGTAYTLPVGLAYRFE